MRRPFGASLLLAAARLFPTFAAACLAGCFSTGDGGSGTETESAFGTVHNLDGTPSVGARVTLRPADYVADVISDSAGNPAYKDIVTDGKGRFAFDTSLTVGSYVVEVSDGKTGLMFDFVLRSEQHQINLGPDTLRAWGSVSGRVKVDSGLPPRPIHVQLYGMKRLAAADSVTGVFRMDSLPRGRYKLRCLIPGPLPMAGEREFYVHSGMERDIHEPPIEMKGDAKLSYRTDGGALEIEGLAAGSPLIYDNERWDNGVDNEYLWAMASAGKLDLRANIVTDPMKTGRSPLSEQIVKARKELRVARLAGLDNIPEPVAGSARKLELVDGYDIEAIPPDPSAGSDLIVAEARKATPQKPLIVIVGGPPTTVANAYLSAPDIVPNMIVVGIFSFTVNDGDPVASYIVHKRCRTVQWGRGYTQSGHLPGASQAQLDALPGSWMHQRIRQSASAARVLPLNDFAPAAHLLRRGLWKYAVRARIAPPAVVTPATDIAFDFLDIPAEANDWGAFHGEFFAAMGDPAAYKPRPVPGRLEAEGFARQAGTALIAAAAPADAEYDLDAVGAIAPGDWLEFSVKPAAAGAATAVIRYRSAQGASLALGPESAPLAQIVLPASASWSEIQASVTLADTAAAAWRAASAQGTFDLDWMEIR